LKTVIIRFVKLHSVSGVLWSVW